MKYMELFLDNFIICEIHVINSELFTPFQGGQYSDYV